MKDFFKEVGRDLLKQVISAIVWSTLVSGGQAVYSYVQVRDTTRECEYSNWFHYHPARFIVCSILKTLDTKRKGD